MARFPSDTFRLYLVEEATYGENMAFQLENMINRCVHIARCPQKYVAVACASLNELAWHRHNVQLADTLGNIVHRVCCLIRSIHGGKVPDCPGVTPRPFDLNQLRSEVDGHFKVGKRVASIVAHAANDSVTTCSVVRPIVCVKLLKLFGLPPAP